MSPVLSKLIWEKVSKGDRWNHEGKVRKRWAVRTRIYKDKVPQVIKNSLHAAAIIPVCLSPVLKQTCELLSPGILICSPNVLWQRNWSHLNTNKLDLAAHLQCRACLQVWRQAEWPPPKSRRGYDWILWCDSGPLVKLGCSERKKKTCVLYPWMIGFWWGIECSRLVDLNLFVRYDCSDIEFGGKKEGSSWQCEREITVQTKSRGWFRKHVEMTVWSVFQNTQAITQPVRTTSLCACSLFSSPCSPSPGHPLQWSVQFLILSLSVYLLTSFFTLLCCAQVQMPNSQYIVHERKKVSILKIPHCKWRSFFFKDQNDKIVVRTPLTCC